MTEPTETNEIPQAGTPKTASPSPEQLQAEADSAALKLALSQIETPVEDIPRFYWNRSLHKQAFVQGLRVMCMPEVARPYLALEQDWVQEPFVDAKWRPDDAIAVGIGTMTCPRCYGDGYVDRNHYGLLTGIG
jgi:hypothetical protein